MKVLEKGHVYQLDEFEAGSPKQVVTFINRFDVNCEHDGTTNEEVLKMLIDRMRFFQQGNFSCRENAICITKLEEALMWLERRTKNRLDQEVEGKNLPHKS